MKTAELVKYLDDYLDVNVIPDYRDAYNGLQAEGRGSTIRIATAVDACKFTIDAAVGMNADILLVHHGLFWGAKAPLTGRYYQRIHAIVAAGLNVYSCHLPLDVHPEVGNNHVLSRQIGLEPSGSFGKYEGIDLGVTASSDLSLEEVTERVSSTLGVTPQVLRCGPSQSRRIGILTGGGGSYIKECSAKSIDTLITGEGAHHTYFDAEEEGINVIYAGHYATETVGVMALGEHLTGRFQLECTFVSHPTGL